MTVKIDTLEGSLRSAANKADTLGTKKDGILDADELSIFTAQAKRNGCDASDIDKICEDARKSELVTYGESKRSESNNGKGEEITADSLKQEAKSKEQEKAKEGKTLGTEIYNNIYGWALDKYSAQYDIANDNLTKVNENNIMDVMAGYYAEKGGLDSYGSYNALLDKEGLIEHLDDEHDGGVITMENKLNVITSLMKKAKSLGLENSKNYRALVMLLSEDYGLNKDTLEADGGSKSNFKSWNSKDWLARLGTNIVTGGIGGGMLAVKVGGTLLGKISAIKNGTSWFSKGIKYIGGIKGGWVFAGLTIATGLITEALTHKRDSEAIDDWMKGLYKEIQNKEKSGVSIEA